MYLLLRWLLNAVSLWLTTQIIPGISFTQPGLWPILIAALVLGLVNAVVRPIMILLTLPLTLLTLGLFFAGCQRHHARYRRRADPAGDDRIWYNADCCACPDDYQHCPQRPDRARPRTRALEAGQTQPAAFASWSLTKK